MTLCLNPPMSDADVLPKTPWGWPQKAQEEGVLDNNQRQPFHPPGEYFPSHRDDLSSLFLCLLAGS
jgi:hypothetical protein